MKKLILLTTFLVTCGFIYTNQEHLRLHSDDAQTEQLELPIMPEPPKKTLVAHQEEQRQEVSPESSQEVDEKENTEQATATLEPDDSGELVLEQKEIIQEPTGPILYPIDKVEAVIFFDEDEKVITSSDVKANLDGRPRTLDDILSMHVMYDKATNKYKIPVNEQTVDKYFTSLQKQHGLSMEQLKDMFAQGGFTYEQGRQELKMMYANNSLVQFLVESRLVVSEDMIQEYYDAHPIFQESKYEIQLASVDTSEGKTKADIKKLIDDYLVTSQGLGLSWSDIFTMKKDDFAEDKKSIIDLNVGEVFVAETPEGFDLFKLLSKQEERFISLEERRAEIEMQIKGPLFYEMVEKVRQEFLEQAAIVKPADAKALEQFNVAA